MDWFSWLSKTGLDSSLLYNYAIMFTNNELDQDDIQYFNHEFLQSMGISIAKHRLEILKLAAKERGRSSSRNHIFWFVVAIRQAKQHFAKHLSTWTHRSDSGSLLPLRNYSERWKASMLKRNKKLTAAKQERSVMQTTNQGRLMMLTNGSPNLMIDSSDTWISSSSSSPTEGFRDDEDMNGVDGGNWPTVAIEEIKWDAMFQDLKPT
ncbi:putative sodium-coupled neutral amino acid transporter 6-like [Capsicum annuum]|nr:putative sodium-coupled neutral amino acid transporter 6-like [Capsicum annuum]